MGYEQASKWGFPWNLLCLLHQLHKIRNSGSWLREMLVFLDILIELICIVWRPNLVSTGLKMTSQNKAIPVASFTKEGNLRLAKRPMKTNGRLASLELTLLVKEATSNQQEQCWLLSDTSFCHQWTSYQIRKIAGCACAGNAGNVFPRPRF